MMRQGPVSQPAVCGVPRAHDIPFDCSLLAASATTNRHSKPQNNPLNRSFYPPHRPAPVGGEIMRGKNNQAEGGGQALLKR